MPSPGFGHHNHCARCPVISAEDIAEEEWYQLLALRFHIQIAQSLCRNHLPVLVDRTTLEVWLENTQIDRAHVEHLPDGLSPGIQITLPSGCGMAIIAPLELFATVKISSSSSSRRQRRWSF